MITRALTVRRCDHGAPVESQISGCLSDGDVVYDASGSVSKLEVLGVRTPPGTDPIEVGDWGVLTLDETFEDVSGRQARFTTAPPPVR